MAGLAAAGAVGVAVAAVSFWLASWIPTQGKAWLETQVERQLPVDLSIGSMHYSPWEGLRLTDVRVIEPKTSILWLEAPQLQARIGLLALLQRQVNLRLKASLLAPTETTLILSGRYALQTRHWTVDQLTASFSVDRVIPSLARSLPQLRAGTVHLSLRAAGQAGRQPDISGRIDGRALVWKQGALQVAGDVLLDGSAIPPAAPATAWTTDLSARIQNASIDGLAKIGRIDGVTGTVHVANGTLETDSLTGQALGSAWNVQGSVVNFAAPRVELLLTGRAQLARVIPPLAPDLQAWKPDGEADLRVVCRGPLVADPAKGGTGWPQIEIQGLAELRNASLTVPKFPHRLEQLTGRVTYDHLTQTLATNEVNGAVQTYPVTLSGMTRLTTPPYVNVLINTQADLGLIKPLLPAQQPVTDLAGSFALHLTLEGSPAKLAWDGTATVREATIVAKGLPAPLKGLTGTVRATNQEVIIDRLAFTLNREPVVLTGTLTSLTGRPRVVANAKLTNGSVSLGGTLFPDRFTVETADVTIGSSQVRIHGDVSRGLGVDHDLTAKGVIELADLARLPWVDPKPFERLDPKGQVDIQFRAHAPADDWKELVVTGLVRASLLQISRLTVTQFAADVEHGKSRLWIKSFDAMVADGKLTGEVIISERKESPDYLVECDWTNLNLAQVAAVVPAWQTRDLRGTASGNLRVLGVRGDPKSLHGQGWVRATGEQLAELPLLDRLFQGVFGALGDRLGLAALRKAQLVELAGQWQLANQRFSTEDLRLTGQAGPEPLMVDVRGSVGMDKTLDLIVTPDLSENLVLQAPNTSALAGTILKFVGGVERLRSLVGRHHVGGTLDQPQYRFEFSLDQMLGQTVPAGVGGLLESIRQQPQQPQQ